MLVKSGYSMKIKQKQPLTNQWVRIFKVLPIKTEDGFRVIFGNVWRMKTDDPFNPVRYHTDPEGKETELKLQKLRALAGLPPRPIPRPKAPPMPPRSERDPWIKYDDSTTQEKLNALIKVRNKIRGRTSLTGPK